jgi:carboxypeptidase family protein/TonB-dependent receptor-like protein
MAPALHVVALVVALSSTAVAATAGSHDRQEPGAAIVRGVVLDADNGSPVADASVQLQQSGLKVKTDSSGRFELTGVRPGRHTVYISIVGFILIKRPIEVTAGQTLDLTIALTEGTGTYSETVNVTTERFREQEKAVPSQQTLGSADIQNLRNPLTNDPMRAIQVLPGVTTGDDFRSEFGVRGSDFNRVNFTFDGIPSTFLLHTVQQEQDGGSIAMVNGDILGGITLLNGSYPQRYGNRLGAELDFQMREGSRDRAQVRIGVSGTDFSLVSEGPLGGRKAGAWLFSVRKSYLDLLLDQISDDNDFGFGFTDVQSKLVYDLSSRHRLELSLVAGRSRLDQTVDAADVNETKDGKNAAELVSLAWRWTPKGSVVLTQRLAVALNQFENTNVQSDELGSGGGRDVTWRADLALVRSPQLTFEGGGQLQWQARDQFQRRFPERVLQSYDTDALFASGYALARWSPNERATLSPGVRVDHWSLADGTSASPWVQGELELGASLKLRGGAGVHRQFPGFEQVAGFRQGTDLRAERAIHADIGVERAIGRDTRVQITFYHRREEGLLRLPDSEVRVVGNQLLLPSQTSRWVNALDGYAKGVELLVQRRSNTGITGWVSYSYGLNRYDDSSTAERFYGDVDQRHTFNAYGMYRVTDRFSLVAKLRLGSNVPAAGYWEQRGSEYFVGTTRNIVRIPTYARLDVRANRTFNWSSKRLTLFVEVLNVFNRDNVRYNTPVVIVRTRQAFGIFESMIPLVPSAGVLIEF